MRQVPPTVELWEFAARYDLLELEKYCLESRVVYDELVDILANQEKGVRHFAALGISVDKLNVLVSRVATAALVDKPCRFCGTPPARQGSSVRPTGRTFVPVHLYGYAPTAASQM